MRERPRTLPIVLTWATLAASISILDADWTIGITALIGEHLTLRASTVVTDGQIGLGAMFILGTFRALPPCPSIPAEGRVFGAACVRLTVTDLTLTVLAEVSWLIITMDIVDAAHTPTPEFTCLTEGAKLVAPLVVLRVTG